MKDLKRANPRQRIFVREYLKTGDQKHALTEAMYKTAHPSKAVKKLLDRPEVQREIDRVIAERWPSLEDDVISQVKRIMMAPTRGIDPEGTVSIAEKIKAAEFLAKIKGHYAPSKTENKSLRANVDFKLPGQED